MSAANEAHSAHGWDQNPWGNDHSEQWARFLNGPSWPRHYFGRPWDGPVFWRPTGISRPVAIAFTVLGFIFWWPVGLALLFYMIGSGRMGCFGSRRRAMRQDNWRDAGPGATWKSWACGSSDSPTSTSGNRAFDEYKEATLRRMEEEQKEFGSFLERLRFAKDKSEFDQFMAERRARPPASPTDEQPAS
jgi:hypothetical protein